MNADSTKPNHSNHSWRTGIPSLEDDQLVRECLAGNSQAFDLLVRKYSNHLFHLLSCMLKDRRDIEDAVQDAFLDALRLLDRYQASGRFAHWLSRLAINQARNRRRSRWLWRVLKLEDMNREDLVLEDPPGLSTRGSSPRALAQAALVEVRFRCVREALLKLPEKLRAPIVLHHISGYSVIEVAEALNIKEGTAGSRIARATERLQAQLGPLFREEFQS